MANAGTYIVTAISTFSGGEAMDNVYLDTIRDMYDPPEEKEDRTGEEIIAYFTEHINCL